MRSTSTIFVMRSRPLRTLLAFLIACFLPSTGHRSLRLLGPCDCRMNHCSELDLVFFRACVSVFRTQQWLCLVAFDLTTACTFTMWRSQAKGFLAIVQNAPTQWRAQKFSGCKRFSLRGRTAFDDQGAIWRHCASTTTLARRGCVLSHLATTSLGCVARVTHPGTLYKWKIIRVFVFEVVQWVLHRL